jgi:hypothetical protein
MRHRAGVARFHRQARLSAVERLDLALFVDREDVYFESGQFNQPKTWRWRPTARSTPVILGGECWIPVPLLPPTRPPSTFSADLGHRRIHNRHGASRARRRLGPVDARRPSPRLRHAAAAALRPCPLPRIRRRADKWRWLPRVPVLAKHQTLAGYGPMRATIARRWRP